MEENIVGREGGADFTPVVRHVEEDERRGRRGLVSAFGADMETGRLTRYGSDPATGAAWEEDVSPGATPESRRVFADMDALVRQGREKRAARRGVMDATLASMLVQAKQNNGYVPADMMEAASANLGQNLAGGNFTQDGSFVLYGRRRDRAGNVSLAPVAVAPPEMQYGVLSRAGLGLSMQGEIYKGLRGRFTEAQLAERGIVDPAKAAAAAARQGRGGGAGAAKAEAPGAGGGLSVKDTLGALQHLREYLDASPDMDDAERQRVQGALSKGVARLAAYFDPPQGAVEDAEAAPAARPDENALERDENGDLPPQEYVKYWQNGRLVAGNGYVRGGRVYDGRGNPVPGAMSQELKALLDEKARRLGAASPAPAKEGQGDTEPDAPAKAAAAAPRVISPIVKRPAPLAKAAEEHGWDEQDEARLDDLYARQRAREEERRRKAAAAKERAEREKDEKARAARAAEARRAGDLYAKGDEASVREADAILARHAEGDEKMDEADRIIAELVKEDEEGKAQ